jgi:hypothetical protein
MYKKAQTTPPPPPLLDTSVLSATVAHMTIHLRSFLSLHPFSWGGGIFIYQDFSFVNFWIEVRKHGSKKF